MHRRMVVGGVALSFLLAIGVALSGALAPGGGTALGASTTLTIISGDVLVSRDGGPFMAAVDGEVLEPGDAIRTGGEARAVLTYFEGSTVTIEPWSELSIDEASAEPDGSTVVLMTQNLGRTWHVVTKLITGGSRYEVRTPAATASVRGTAFEVGVAQTETGEIVTAVVTAEGIVAAAAPATQADPAPQAVLVQAGFQTTARSTERAPEAPVRAPEPLRTVSVSVGTENTLVVDPLGRANGVKDGRVILQTPGASVSQADGKVIVTMPNIPDGKIATVVNRRSSGSGNDSAPVEVVTTVEERGKPANTVSDSVVPTNEPVTTGVEVQQSGPGPEATPGLRPMREDETKQLPTPKTAVEPAPAVSLPVIGDALRAVGAANAVSNERASGQGSQQAAPAEPRRSEEQGSSSGGFFPAIPLGALPGAQAELAGQERRRAEEERKRFEDDARRAAEQTKKAAEEAAKRAEEDAQRAAEAARKAAEEAAKRVQEAEQAARRIVEEAKRAEEEAKRVAEAARSAAEEARQRAEEQARLAAEQAKKAADEVARRAQEQARIAAEQARQAAEDEAKRAEQEAKKAADEAKKEAEQALKRAESAATREIDAAKNRLKDAEKKLQSALRGIDVSAIAAARSELTAATKALADAEVALARIKDALSRL